MSNRRDSEFPSSDSTTPSRRSEERFEVRWAVDCASEDTFLYAYITNVSAMGLFVRTERPLAVGTRVHLCFSPGPTPLGAESRAEDAREFELVGEVAWINPHKSNGENPNPGMGIRFLDLEAQDRERLVEAIHTIAYVRDHEPTN